MCMCTDATTCTLHQLQKNPKNGKYKNSNRLRKYKWHWLIAAERRSWRKYINRTETSAPQGKAAHLYGWLKKTASTMWHLEAGLSSVCIRALDQVWLTRLATSVLTGGCSTSILLSDERGSASERSNLQEQSGRRGRRPSCCISASFSPPKVFFELCHFCKWIQMNAVWQIGCNLYPKGLQITF